jgi:hypothetical protein
VDGEGSPPWECVLAQLTAPYGLQAPSNGAYPVKSAPGLGSRPLSHPPTRRRGWWRSSRTELVLHSWGRFTRRGAAATPSETISGRNLWAGPSCGLGRQDVLIRTKSSGVPDAYTWDSLTWPNPPLAAPPRQQGALSSLSGAEVYTPAFQPGRPTAAYDSATSSPSPPSSSPRPYRCTPASPPPVGRYLSYPQTPIRPRTALTPDPGGLRSRGHPHGTSGSRARRGQSYGSGPSPPLALPETAGSKVAQTPPPRARS